MKGDIVLKTALYIRVSTDSQFEEGYSVDAQKEKLEQYCKLKDISEYEFYIDGGWSGSNIKRPEMTRLISEIKQHQISAVIVYKLDRLSRSQKDTVFLLEDVFIPNNCNFISLNENFDTTTPYGKAMIGILSVFAQLERENIRERTRMGMYERVKLGMWTGGGNKPFGYDYDRNKNILVPNEHADDVRKIYDLYLQGYSTTQLANMFDVSTDKQITDILDRVTYLGKISYKGEIIEGQHEPIIDEDTWNRVQIERKKRSTKNVVTSTYLFTGLLRCGVCGAKMRYQKWGKNGLKIYCYSQQTSKKHLIKDENCDNYKVDACDIESIVLADLFKRTANIQSTNKYMAFQTSALQVLQRKYEMLSAKIKRLYNLYALDGNELLLATINDNKRELAKVSEDLSNEENLQANVKSINEKNQMICNLQNTWDSMTIKEKQQALRICIDYIEIKHDKIDIHYNF